MPEVVTATPGNAGGSSAASSAPASSAPASSAPASTSSTPSSTTTHGPGSGAPASPESALASLERVSASLESASSPDKPADGSKPASATTGAPNADGKGGVATPDASTGGEFHLPKSKEDYDRILGNARQKAVEEALKPLAWARELKKEEVMGAAQLFREIQADPVKWAKDILAEAGEGTNEEDDLTDPDPDYQSPDGKAQFYSGATVKKLLSNLEKRLLQQVDPAMQLVQNQRKAEERATIMREAQTTASEAMDVLKQDPRFEANKAALHEALSKVDPRVRARIGSIATLFMCWNKVVADKVIPNAEAAGEKRLQEDLTRQAAAAVGSVVPGGTPSVRKPVKDGDVDALAKRMGELAEQMAAQ